MKVYDILVHDKLRGPVCEECGNEYAMYNENLVCEECGATFCQKGSLTRHIEGSHLKKKMY